MGAMIMAKSTMAGGLPGAMAPPEGMTAVGIAWFRRRHRNWFSNGTGNYFY